MKIEDPLKEIQKITKDAIKDRTSNPTTATLIISWLIWNFKIILVIFSGENIYAQFNEINNILYTTIYGEITTDPIIYLFNTIIIPIIITAIYIAAYLPITTYINKFIYGLRGKMKREQFTYEDSKVTSDIDNRILKLTNENKKLYRNNADFQSELATAKSHIDIDNKEISGLKEQLRIANSDYDILKAALEKAKRV